MRIERDDLTHPQVVALLGEHLANMHAITPAGHVFALDLSGLQSPDITFYTVWEGEQLLGCGALKQLSATHGEIKSMRTPQALRGRGAGRAMLAHLIAQARQRGYTRLSLETGAAEAFVPAHRLYESAGFVRCGRFGDYPDSAHSVFMTLTLNGSAAESA